MSGSCSPIGRPCSRSRCGARGEGCRHGAPAAHRRRARRRSPPRPAADGVAVGDDADRPRRPPPRPASISRRQLRSGRSSTALGLTVTRCSPISARAAGSRFAGQEVGEQMRASLETAELGQVVILGFGRVGRMVADMLETHGKDYLAIDSDADSVGAAREEGLRRPFRRRRPARADRRTARAQNRPRSSSPWTIRCW